MFWFNMAMGCGLAVVVAACGPLIAWVYKEDRLQMVALVSSLQLVFVAISCQHNALLRRAMMFNRIAAAQVFGNLLGAAIVIAMAAQGLEYWALVARPILTAMLTSGGILLACPWLPGLPSLTAEVRHLLRFGMNITGFTVLDSVSRSADRFALGVTSNARDVGLYQQAIGLYESPLYLITHPLHGVAVTSLSKLREHLEDLRRTWTKALSAMTFYAMPAFGVLAVVSRDLIVLLLGVKWSYTGVLLSILAVRGVVHVVERTWDGSMSPRQGGPMASVGSLQHSVSAGCGGLRSAVWSHRSGDRPCADDLCSFPANDCVCRPTPGHWDRHGREGCVSTASWGPCIHTDRCVCAALPAGTISCSIAYRVRKCDLRQQLPGYRRVVVRHKGTAASSPVGDQGFYSVNQVSDTFPAMSEL